MTSLIIKLCKKLEFKVTQTCSHSIGPLVAWNGNLTSEILTETY